VPGVIYGDKQPPLSILIDRSVLRQRIFAGHFLTSVCEITIGGKKHRVIPRDYQLDPVKDKAMHVDFLRVGPNTKLHVQVAVHFVNQESSPGIKKGGVLNIVHHTLDMVCPASAIPEAITIDLTGKDVGDSIHLSSIELPKGTSVRSHEKDMTIATIAAPSALRSDEAAAPAAEAAAVAAPAAGTAAAPAAGAKPAPAAPAKK
jgi:large subunit ribosomal protein L25